MTNTNWGGQEQCIENKRIRVTQQWPALLANTTTGGTRKPPFGLIRMFHTWFLYRKIPRTIFAAKLRKNKKPKLTMQYALSFVECLKLHKLKIKILNMFMAYALTSWFNPVTSYF